MTKNSQDRITKEAVVFTRHIIGQGPSDTAVKLYTRAIEQQKDTLSKDDERLLDIVDKHPSITPYLDAGLAFLKPHSEVRRRLYLMFAILESLPEYTEFFLPVNRSPWYLFVVIGLGIQSVWRLVIGITIVKVVTK